MKEVTLPFPVLLGIGATRAMLGAGLALLLGDRLDERNRRLLGGILAAVGILTTAPFAYQILYHRRDA